MASCVCNGAVKVLLCVLDFIFTLLGLAIVAIATFFLVCRENLALEFPPQYLYGAVVVGIVFFFVGVAGCVGAVRGSNCLLITCSVLLLILAVVKITLIILIFNNKGALKDHILQLVNEPGNHKSNNALVAGEFHLFEYMGACCGTTGPASYNSIDVIPSSCCLVGFTKPEKTCKIDDAYKTGCQDKVALEKALGTLLWIAYSAIILAVLEITALFSAIYLSCTSNEKYGYHEYE